MKTNFHNKIVDAKEYGSRLPNSNGIETIVMARVRRIHFMRRFFTATTIKVYGAGVLMVALVSLVSVTNVYANMPSLMTKEFFTFAFSAVLNTEIIVKLLLVSFGVVTTLTVKDILKNSKEKLVFFTRAQI